MSKLVVNPGVCGMISTIKVTKINRRRCRIEITSDCEMVSNMGQSMGEADITDALQVPIKSHVYNCASECCLHPSCPIPMAILKAIEVEFGLALPRSISVNFESE